MSRLAFFQAKMGNLPHQLNFSVVGFFCFGFFVCFFERTSEVFYDFIPITICSQVIKVISQTFNDVRDVAYGLR